MRCVHFVLGGLLLASQALPAWSQEPYYDESAATPAVGSYGEMPGYAVGYSSGYGHGYGNGYGYGYGHGSCESCGHGVPGCCERPWTKNLHLWDGYCQKKSRVWQPKCMPAWAHLGLPSGSGCHAAMPALAAPACTAAPGCTAGYAAEPAHGPVEQPTMVEEAVPQPPLPDVSTDSPQVKRHKNLLRLRKA